MSPRTRERISNVINSWWVTLVSRVFILIGTCLLGFMATTGKGMVAQVVDSGVSRSSAVIELRKVDSLQKQIDSIQDVRITETAKRGEAIENKMDAFITASMNSNDDLRKSLLEMVDEDPAAVKRAADNQKILERLSSNKGAK